MPNKTGGPAFPRPYGEAKISLNQTAYNEPRLGMTLRQYYKAKAMQGLLAFNGERNWHNLAIQAGALADALLAEDEEFERRGGADT